MAQEEKAPPPAPADSPPGEWLDISEACRVLGISEQTMFRWMRSGKVTFYKIGKATRFKRRDLDLLVEKVVSRLEGEILSDRCAVCGHAFLVEGRLSGTGRIYFKPQKTKFFVLAESLVPVSARACPACGNVHLNADVSKLQRLMPGKKEKAEKEEQ